MYNGFAGRMKIYAGLHGDMQKPRIKSRGDNNSTTMSKLAFCDSVKPKVDGTAALKLSTAFGNMNAVASASERLGDFVALLQSNL